MAAGVDADAFARLQPQEWFRAFVKHSLRPDGRGLEAARKTKIEPGVVPGADGSVLVRLGATAVVAGVRAEVAIPSDDRPDDGELVVQAELTPLASADFRPGRPSMQGQVLNGVLQHVLQQCEPVQASSLVIESGKAVWVLHLTLYCVDFDGNLVDAMLLALSAALRNTTLPDVEFIEAEGCVRRTGASVRHPLTLHHLPHSVTFGVFEDSVLLDPTRAEEQLLTSSLTIVHDQAGEMRYLRQAGGAVGLSMQRIQQCIAMARQRASQLSQQQQQQQ